MASKILVFKSTAIFCNILKYNINMALDIFMQSLLYELICRV